MVVACPIARFSVDRNVTRLVAAEVTLASLSVVLFSSPILPGLLTLDFALRAAGRFRLSPFSLAARFAARWMGLASTPVDAGPKLFAARIGLAMSAIMLAGEIAGLRHLTMVLGAALAVCAGLEMAIGFCIACQMYGRIWPWLSQGTAR